MATPSEHVAAIKKAIADAEADGCLVQLWDVTERTWLNPNPESACVDVMLVRNKRGEDGIMRNEFRDKITTWWT